MTLPARVKTAFTLKKMSKHRSWRSSKWRQVWGPPMEHALLRKPSLGCIRCAGVAMGADKVLKQAKKPRTRNPTSDPCIAPGSLCVVGFCGRSAVPPGGHCHHRFCGTWAPSPVRTRQDGFCGGLAVPRFLLL
mmetsp:Transcript_64432/g.172515  ORF Transcript_64432/g.172515 Transcript_64432/m.172515 type:complete len:133 (+) Transcript_64432:1143-1541(+)